MGNEEGSMISLLQKDIDKINSLVALRNSSEHNHKEGLSFYKVKDCVYCDYDKQIARAYIRGCKSVITVKVRV